MIRAGQAPFGTLEMDELDRRIMKLLRPNARRSYASIARAVGVSEPTVRNRVDRLVSNGAIFPMARVNPAAIGFPVDAMVGIRVNRGYAKGVGARLAAMENVAYVGYTTGSFDILIEAHLPDNEGLYKFLNGYRRRSKVSPTPRPGTSCAPTRPTSSGKARTSAGSRWMVSRSRDGYRLYRPGAHRPPSRRQSARRWP